MPSAYTLRKAFQPFEEISTLCPLKVSSEITFLFQNENNSFSDIKKEHAHCEDTKLF